MARKIQKPLLIYSPLIAKGIPKLDRGTQSYDDYWEEQRYYCTHGYKPKGADKISAKHYFHLNIWKIDRLAFPFDDTDAKTLIAYPLYRKFDHGVIDHLAACREALLNAIFGKFRRAALTDICVSDMAQEMLFNEKAKCAWLVPAEVNFTNTLHKFYTGMANLPDGLYQDILVDNDKDGCVIGFNIKDENNNWIRSGSLSTLTKKIASKAGVLKGAKQRIVLMDEVGEYSKESVTLRQVYAETDQCVKEGGYRFGLCILAGTSDKINNKNPDYELMYNSPEGFGLMKHFIPSSKWYYSVTKKEHLFDFSTGESKEKEATEEIMMEREKFNQLPDKQDLYKFMQNQPLIEGDMWIVTGESSLDTARVNERIQAIHSDPKAFNYVQVGRFVEDDNPAFKLTGGVKFIPDASGRFRITEHPLNHVYPGIDIAAADDYMKDRAPDSVSKGAIVVYRRFGSADMACRIPVMVYHYRPPSLREFYNDCLLVCRYYQCEIAFEMNVSQPNLSPPYEFFKSKNALKYLKQYPLIQGKKVRRSEAFGYQVRQNEIEITNLKLNDFISSPELNNVFDLKFLNELALTGRTNTDIISAFRVCLLYSDDMRFVKVEKTINPEEMKEVIEEAPRKKFHEFTFSPSENGHPKINWGSSSLKMDMPWAKSLRRKMESPRPKF